ncbi:hypothetical protein evm_012062 [Chilo suppressalis]|nr:hypothetical protein evm_012062 [Chilo suppressalis]
MMSNRFDRDNYVVVNWKNVQQGKEHFLEKSPEASWLPNLPYDFRSVTHAPANYMCRDCDSPVAAQTVLPIQDHLWQKTLSMGHHVTLSKGDEELLALLYGKQCEARYVVRT